MYFKQFLHDETGCASYLIASRQSREAAVVDPQYDIQHYLDLAAERDYRITEVIDTHIHADHVSGNRRLAEASGARLWLHEAAEVVFPFHKLRDDAVLRLGPLELHVVHTPGHTPDGVSLLVINPPRSPEPSIVLSGDALFVGDVGRPDFGGPSGAIEEYASIQRLLRLNDYVAVFPAHFEGPCGKGMCGRPSTTIGFERRFNPMLQLSEDEFVKSAAQAPARPLNMDAIVETNRGSADYSWVVTGWDAEAPTIAVGEAAEWISTRDALVVDVREPSEYAAGHLPGAVSIPQAEIAVRMAEVPRDREVVVVCAGGGRSLRAATFLKEIGYDRVTNLAGGTDGWRAAGHPIQIEGVAAGHA